MNGLLASRPWLALIAVHPDDTHHCFTLGVREVDPFSSGASELRSMTPLAESHWLPLHAHNAS